MSSIAEETIKNDVFVTFAKVTLVLVNMIFLLGGSALTYFSLRLHNSGWLSAFEGEYAWIGNWTFYFTLSLSIGICTLALIGCVGAWLRNRLILTIYAGVAIITTILFLVLAYLSFTAANKAIEWETSSYPAGESESALGANFNQLYCLAQVPYYCNEAEVPEVLQVFQVDVSDIVLNQLGTPSNFSSLCIDSTISQIDDVCKVCSVVNTYEQYRPVLEWAEERCPRTYENQGWCGAFVIAQKPPSSDPTAYNSPYGGCRRQFFKLIEKWARRLFTGGLITALCVFVMFVFTMIARRRDSFTRDKFRGSNIYESFHSTHRKSTTPPPVEPKNSYGQMHRIQSNPNDQIYLRNQNINQGTSQLNYQQPQQFYPTAQISKYDYNSHEYLTQQIY